MCVPFYNANKTNPQVQKKIIFQNFNLSIIFWPWRSFIEIQPKKRKRKKKLWFLNVVIHDFAAVETT